MNTVRAGKIQYPRMISYCAPIILGLAILAGGFSYPLSPQLRAIGLILPLPIGIILGVALYYRFAHEMVKYDEKGFEVIRGVRPSKSFEWNQFVEVSLHADPKRGVNVRLYFQPDGEYVDVPGTKVGLDPFSLRDSLADKLKKA